MVKLIAVICLACAFSMQAFVQDNYEAFKKELTSKLGLLSAYTNMFDGDEYSDIEELDPDSLSMVIAGELAAYIENNGFRDIDIEDMPQIDYYISENDSTFRVYTVGYNSRGSAGWIPSPIIIKQEGSKQKLFDLSYLMCSFSHFYRLRDEVYLCVGYAPGWGTCRNNGICVIDFGKEDAELVPAFDGETYFSLCNSDIYFDHSHGILTIDIHYFAPYNDDENCQTFFDTYYEGLPSFSLECYTESDHTQEDMAVVLTSVFDGEKFVKPGSATGR